jgi:hypothetical protein
MIFNTWDYYLLFLIPSAVSFRLASPRVRPWIIFFSGSLFFTYFSYTQLGGLAGALCLGIFLWESFVSRFYKPRSWVCWAGITQTVIFLAIFKYRNFLTGLWWPVAGHNPLYWKNAFLPLGISFFTFEFVHYAVDRYRSKTESGSLGEYLAFILFFPTMVAGPIKRYEDFLPKLRSVSREWALDWQRGITRILAGLAKKFAIADLLTAYTNHLNRTDISHAHRAVLPLWLLAYGIKIYIDFSAYSDRLGTIVWNRGSRKFRLALRAHQYRGVLAALAHVAHPVADGLHLYPAGRLARTSGARLRQHHCNHVHQRHLAWRGPELHRVGLVPWRAAGDSPRLAPAISASRGRLAAVGTIARVVSDVCIGEPGVGVFLHGLEDSHLFFPAAADWINRRIRANGFNKPWNTWAGSRTKPRQVFRLRFRTGCSGACGGGLWPL